MYTRPIPNGFRDRVILLYSSKIVDKKKILRTVSNLSIYNSTALVDLDRFFSFFIYTQTVGHLGREISPSQGRYLHTEQHKQNKRTQTSMF
jgi:hypothetical protein